jgi:Fe-S-cluster containining protein
VSTYCLSSHARYRCRSSGRCCRAGWEIPVEPPVERMIRNALQDRRLSLAAPDGPSGVDRLLTRTVDGGRVTLGLGPTGACRLLESDNRCAIHRQLGEGSKPSTCRHFPQVCLLTPRGVAVTLSHFCPTVAATALAPVPVLSVVRNAPSFPPDAEYAGLDAREAWPPLLRPGTLMGWDSYAAWERHAVATLGGGQRPPEEAILLLAEAAEEARGWRPRHGPFPAHLATVLSRPRARPRRGRIDHEGLRLHAEAVAAVPPALRSRVPAGDVAGETELVAPHWHRHFEAIGRYLAARAFASWVALQGQGLRTTVLAVAMALAVLRVEAARACRERDRPLDGEVLAEALAGADLLLAHLAEPDRLAEGLSRVEALDTRTWLARLRA